MPTNFKELIGVFVDLMTALMPVILGLALLSFFWGLVKFVSKAGDAKSHADGKNLIVWGLIGIFVMLSFTGIIYFFYSDLGFNASHPFGLPTLPNPVGK